MRRRGESSLPHRCDRESAHVANAVHAEVKLREPAAPATAASAAASAATDAASRTACSAATIAASNSGRARARHRKGFLAARTAQRRGGSRFAQPGRDGDGPGVPDVVTVQVQHRERGRGAATTPIAIAIVAFAVGIAPVTTIVVIVVVVVVAVLVIVHILHAAGPGRRCPRERRRQAPRALGPEVGLHEVQFHHHLRPALQAALGPAIPWAPAIPCCPAAGSPAAHPLPPTLPWCSPPAQ